MSFRNVNLPQDLLCLSLVFAYVIFLIQLNGTWSPQVCCYELFELDGIVAHVPHVCMRVNEIYISIERKISYR